MKNLKTTIITALLLIAMVSGAVAQEKWEYASIQYSYAGSKGCAMRITIGEKSFEEVFVPKESYEGWWGMDLRPVFKKINEMEGWELFSTSAMGAVNGTDPARYMFYMRKKK